MRFTVKSFPISNLTARLGTISHVERLQGFETDTPALFLYTKGGSVPHISHEVLRWISQEKLGVMIPVPTIAHIEDRMIHWDKGIADFVGLKEYLTYCSITDQGQARLEGHHQKDTIAVWGRHGKKQYTAETYMAFLEHLKPDMFLVLCDGDTVESSSNKRVSKSVENTLDLLKKCSALYDKSDKLQQSAMLGALEGGYSPEAREKCGLAVGQCNVQGVVLGGLHNCSKDVLDMDIQNISHLITASLKHIPCDKLRMMHGCWNPKTLLGLIELGIDVFDSSYPYVVAEKGRALIFPNDDSLLATNMQPIHCDHSVKAESDENKSPTAEPNDTQDKDVLKNLRPAVNSSGEPNAKRFKVESAISPYEMSLYDTVHAESFIPISSSCTCLACQKHTRAYIHHLLNVNELLASVLLSIHNMHHYLGFFKTIREAIKTDCFHTLKTKFT